MNAGKLAAGFIVVIALLGGAVLYYTQVYAFYHPAAFTPGQEILLTTHDLALASDLADRIAVMYAGEFVEIGSAEQILTSPRHPYTKKLLGSIPRLASDSRPEFIPGTPPKMTTPPEGCYFSPRCPRACEACAVHPELRACGPGHEARCQLLRIT